MDEKLAVISLQDHDRVVAEMQRRIEKLEAALRFYADGKHAHEKDHDVIQVVPGKEEFIDHIYGSRAREALKGEG